MNGIKKRVSSLFMAAAMLLSVAVTPAVAAEESKAPPTEVKSSSNFGWDFKLKFKNASEWLNAIESVEVSGAKWNRVSNFSLVWKNKSFYVDAGSGTVYVGEDFSGNTATCVIAAQGYRPLTLALDKDTHKAEIVEGTDPGGGGSGGEAPGSPELGTVELSKVHFAMDPTGNDWRVSFEEAGYADKITGVSVNGASWQAASSSLANGGQYKLEGGMLLFARNS